MCSLVSETALKAPSAVLFHRCVDSHTANGRAELYYVSVMIAFLLKAPSSIPHTATTTNPLFSPFWKSKKRACYCNLASFYGS